MIRYVTVPPTGNATNYKNGQTLEFQLRLARGQALQAKSIYVTGTLKVLVGGNPIDNTNADQKLIQYDAQAGIHGFFLNASSYIDGKNIEAITDYPQLAHNIFEANSHYITQANSNSSTMELRCGVDSYTNYVMLGVQDVAGANTGENSFAFKPLVALNGTSRDITGYDCETVKLVFVMNSTANIPYNPAGVPDITWEISDVLLHTLYIEDPTMERPKDKLSYIKRVVYNNTLSTSRGSFSYTLNERIMANSMTFNRRDDALKPWTTDILPNVTLVSVNIGGSEYVLRYPLTNNGEIVYNYIKSLNYGVLESNAIYGSLTGSGWGIGLNYGQPIDTAGMPLSVYINSDVGLMSESYDMFIIFTCVAALT
jgi:hypothetical protein